MGQPGGREDQEAKTRGRLSVGEGVWLGVTLHLEYRLVCYPLIQQTLTIDYMSLPQRASRVWEDTSVDK